MLDGISRHCVGVPVDLVRLVRRDRSVIHDDDRYAGFDGFLDCAVQSRSASWIDDDRVHAVKNEALDLRHLGRDIVVRLQHLVALQRPVSNHLVCQFLEKRFHRLAVRVAAIGIGEPDRKALRFRPGFRISCSKGEYTRCKERCRNKRNDPFPIHLQSSVREIVMTAVDQKPGEP